MLISSESGAEDFSPGLSRPALPSWMQARPLHALQAGGVPLGVHTQRARTPGGVGEDYADPKHRLPSLACGHI